VSKGNVVIIAGACVVIVGAIVWSLKGRLVEAPPPGHVLAGTKTYICGKCDKECTLTLEDWVALHQDDSTGYRKCPSCGELALGHVMICASCGAHIVAPPSAKTSAEDEEDEDPMAEFSYKCPKCKKSAFDVGLQPRPRRPQR